MQLQSFVVSFLIFLVFLASHVNARQIAAPDASERLPEMPGGYIYPILTHGPNNQVAGLKEVLVIGRLLRRTVILHDIITHYVEREEAAEQPELHSQPKTMPFNLLFDQPYLERHQSVVTLAERRAAGWNSRLGAVVHFGKTYLGQIKTAWAFNISDERATYIDYKEFECTQPQLDDMIEQLAKYKTVGFLTYENIVRDAGHGVKLRVTGELCHDEYLLVSAQLTKSPTLVSLAAAFRERHLGGANKRFAAVHIRPYPDKCLFVWRHPYKEGLAKKMCKNANLYNVFVSQTATAMKRHELTSLFVMTVPELRTKVESMYTAEGITPIFYDERELEEAMGYMSVSLLGMVEEEIAFEANIFIGTSYSSMTGIIMQERYARGKPPHTTWTFTRTT